MTSLGEQLRREVRERVRLSPDAYERTLRIAGRQERFRRIAIMVPTILVTIALVAGLWAIAATNARHDVRPGGNGASQPSPGASPSLTPGSPSPPPLARQIQNGADYTNGPSFGVAVTTFWTDLEDGMFVDVVAGSLESNPSQGLVRIVVTDPSNAEDLSPSVGGITSASFLTPSPVGPLVLTSVTGSLSTDDLRVTFSYPGGTGTFDPETGTFAM